MSARALTTALIAAAGLALSACGFTPLYATPGVVPGLSAIQVVVPQGRTAYLLRENLDDELGKDHTAKPAYRLNILVDERRYARGLLSNDVADRYELHINVAYTLIALDTGKTLKTGYVPVQVTYDSPDSPYAGIATQQDGQRRAAGDAAQRIRTDLALYFAGLNKAP